MSKGVSRRVWRGFKRWGDEVERKGNFLRREGRLRGVSEADLGHDSRFFD